VVVIATGAVIASALNHALQPGQEQMDRPIVGSYRRAYEEAMSQHKHTTRTRDGKEVTVTLGYDRPLDYVFCTVIQDSEGTSEGEDIIYSKLGDDDAGLHLQDVDYFRDVLNELGISVPDELFTEVKIDQLKRVGNRTVDPKPKN